MMDNNVISFTKLGTVKSKIIGECTYDSFFERMKTLIDKDVANYRIIYEKNKKEYKIIYKGNTYQVTYGEEPLKEDCKRKDVVDKLNRLVSISSDLKRIHDEETKKELDERENLDRIIKNANEGVYVSNKDKEVYLEYLIREDKKDPFFKRLFRRIKGNLFYSDYDSDIGEARLLVSVVTTIATTLFIAVASALTFIPISTVLYILLGVGLGSDFLYSLITYLIHENSYTISMEGKFGGPLAIVWALLHLPRHIVVTAMEKIKEKNTIKSIESSLVNGRKRKVKEPQISKKQLEALKKEFEIDGKKEDKVQKKDPVSETIDITSREFERLSIKVKKIETDSKRNEASKELVGIIRDYMKKSVLFLKTGIIDYDYQESIEKSLKAFEAKVDIVLEDEEKERQTKQEFNQVYEAIDQTTHYRSSGR